MSRTKKKLLAMCTVCTAGMLFQAGLTGFIPGSCAQWYFQSAVESFDFCSVFNCTGGTFLNVCEPVPLFRDCPNYQPGGQP